MNTQREQLIQSWIASVLGSDQFETHFLAGDASFRRYARIKLNNKTFMLMDAPPEKEDCVPFVTIDEFFDAHGVRVPHIVAKDLENGFLLLEDFGDVLLSNLLICCSLYLFSFFSLFFSINCSNIIIISILICNILNIK